MLKKLFAISLIFISTAAIADSSENASGIVYGKDNAYILTAPNGWVSDNQTAAKIGVYAAFYPQGGSWGQSPAIMYSRASEKAGKNFDEIIADDISEFKTHFKNGEISDGTPLKTHDGKTAVVKNFIGDKANAYESVAYINEAKTVSMIVLSAKTKNDFEKAKPAFENLVNSYQYWTSNVNIMDKK